MSHRAKSELCHVCVQPWKQLLHVPTSWGWVKKVTTVRDLVRDNTRYTARALQDSAKEIVRDGVELRVRVR